MPLSHTAWLNIQGLKSYIKFGLSHCCWTNKSVYMNRTLWCLTPNYKISLKYLLCIVLFPVQKMAHIFSSSFYDVWYFQTLCRYGCFGLIETHDIYMYFIIFIEDWQRLHSYIIDVWVQHNNYGFLRLIHAFHYVFAVVAAMSRIILCRHLQMINIYL